MRPEAWAAIGELIAACENPHLIATDPRRMERPVFGCLTPHVPLELIHAAGIIPVRLQDHRTAPLSSSHLQSFTCGFSRTAIEGVAGGRYSYIEGLLAAKTCDVGLSVFQICQEIHPYGFSWLVSLPGNCDSGSVAYLAQEFAALKSALEAYSGTEISSESLRRSISLYNELRKAVKELWRRRDIRSLPIAAGEVVRALKGAQVLPPESALSLMEKFLSGEDAPEQNLSEGVRLLLTGNSYADAGLVDMMERLGSRVVWEDTTSLGRYFGDTVDLKGDPVESLAEYYASSVTGCYRLSLTMRLDHIRTALRDWRADACINLVQKFCDTSLFEAPLLEEAMQEWGIPYLLLEIEDGSPGFGQLETRVEAFLEMVGGIE